MCIYIIFFRRSLRSAVKYRIGSPYSFKFDISQVGKFLQHSCLNSAYYYVVVVVDIDHDDVLLHVWYYCSCRR